jgi:hydroxymethylglutaryl-CoA reductase (NADPH)
MSKKNNSKKLNQFKTRKERLEYIQETTDTDLKNIQNSFADDEHLEKVHCENLLGAISVPVGLAGPVKINPIFHAKELDLFQNQEFYIPQATTEGALVASVSRGIKAINLAGGANLFVEKMGTTRGPVLATESLSESIKLKKWFEQNEALIKQTLEQKSSHLKLLKYDFKILASRCYIRFYFETGDAMGMNMATIATQTLAGLIKEKIGIKTVSVSGNYCIDKKPSWLNFINGRGYSVQAEVVLNQKILQEVLRVDLEDLYQTWLDKCMIGTAMAGGLGFNAHFANVAAAFFIATGQDPAQVVEASQGITSMKKTKENNLNISIYMPAVLLATVGGGTKLNCQREILNLLKVKKAESLAMILGSAVLAGEISLLSSQTEGSLAKAHQSLGR